MRSLDTYIDESFYRNTGSHDYVTIQKAIDELNQINNDWKHEEIPVRDGIKKILKRLAPIIGDFVIVQKCIKGYTSHYIYYDPADPEFDKWWTVGTLYIHTTRDDNISINRTNIDTGSNKYIGNRIMCEIEAGLVEEFLLGRKDNNNIIIEK